MIFEKHVNNEFQIKLHTVFLKNLTWNSFDKKKVSQTSGKKNKKDFEYSNTRISYDLSIRRVIFFRLFYIDKTTHENGIIK